MKPLWIVIEDAQGKKTVYAYSTAAKAEAARDILEDAQEATVDDDPTVWIFQVVIDTLPSRAQGGR